MTIILYEHPYSPYAQKCKIALREKNLPFEARIPEGLGSGSLQNNEFKRAGLRGEVPALIDDGFAIFDSTVILEYLEDRWPQPSLLPASANERAQVRMLEDLMDTHYEAINWGLFELNFFNCCFGELARQIKAQAEEQLDFWFRYLEDQLGDRNWFNGDTFGWGDIAVIPYLNTSIDHGFSPRKDSPLRHWHTRVMARSSVKQTNDEGLAIIPLLREAPNWLAQGMKREYRDHRLEWMMRSGGIDIVLSGLQNDNIRFFKEGSY